VKWSYEQLRDKIAGLAGGLATLGYQTGDIVATEATQSTMTLLMQLAASHNGMKVLTVSSAEELDRITPQIYVKGAVMQSKSSFLNDASVSKKTLITDIKQKASDKEGCTNRDLDLAYYGNSEPVPNRRLYLAGVGTAGLLEIQKADQVCIGSSLSSMIGVGGFMSAIVRNATVYIPDLSNPDLHESTILITDKDRLDTFRGITTSGKSQLRGGLVQVSDGDKILNSKEDLAGASLYTMGESSTYMRPLFDACVDTYYSYK
jgi:hypothetical protein